MRYGGGIPHYFHCLKVNWNKTWSCARMSQIVPKTIIKVMTSPLVPCNYAILCFRGQSPTFDKHFISRGIKLKFGGGVNSETLISYFMSILSNEMNLMKIMGFLCHFLLILLEP